MRSAKSTTALLDLMDGPTGSFLDQGAAHIWLREPRWGWTICLGIPSPGLYSSAGTSTFTGGTGTPCFGKTKVLVTPTSSRSRPTSMGTGRSTRTAESGRATHYDRNRPANRTLA